MRVLFPEYRLVPDHPFPAAIDEVHRCHSRASPTATAACSATIRSCHPCWSRRGAARPPAHRPGQHRPRHRPCCPLLYAPDMPQAPRSSSDVSDEV